MFDQIWDSGIRVTKRTNFNDDLMVIIIGTDGNIPGGNKTVVGPPIYSHVYSICWCISGPLFMELYILQLSRNSRNSGPDHVT
mgnify:CR=1 FL=1